MKWSDFCISKISFEENNKIISQAIVHIDNGDTIGIGINRDRNWLIQQINNGKSFTCINRTTDNKWLNLCNFNYSAGSFKWNSKLPRILTKRKSFISYFHKDDDLYRVKFENLTKDLIVNKSVQKDDIDSENSDEYIKQLIQKEYLKDTTVLIVLISSKTKCRKHIDWEISGALNYKVGDNYSGLLGLLLPEHPDYGSEKATFDLLPSRFSDNFKSGYAILRDWTENREKLQSYIELAYNNRKKQIENKINSRTQMQKNTCE